MKCYKIGRQSEKMELNSLLQLLIGFRNLFDSAKGFDIMFYAILLTFISNSTAFILVVRLKMIS